MLKTPQPNCEVYHIYNPVRSSDEEKHSPSMTTWISLIFHNMMSYFFLMLQRNTVNSSQNLEVSNCNLLTVDHYPCDHSLLFPGHESQAVYVPREGHLDEVIFSRGCPCAGNQGNWHAVWIAGCPTIHKGWQRRHGTSEAGLCTCSLLAFEGW